MKTLLVAGAALPLLAGCDWLRPKDDATKARESALERTLAQRRKAACSSQVTYDRLKEVVFDEAIRIRNADPVNLDKLANYSVVRMENPVVERHDAALDVTVCSGRFILEIPPGAERAFGGERRLVADVEYAAQAAADGRGLVYQINGAEPIVYKLAAFDLRNAGAGRPVLVAPSPSPDDTRLASADAAEAPVPSRRPAESAPPPPPPPPPRPRETASPRAREMAPPRPSQPSPRPAAAPEPKRPAQAATTRSANPSFNCRNARTRSERMVCGSGRLAGLDRSMASQYYEALDGADPETRAELRRSRDRFLRFRERCASESCVAQAYRDRMNEIDDIAGR